MGKLDDLIFYNLDKSIRVYRQYAQAQIIRAGYTITIDQWLVIKSILENPGISQSQLSSLVFKDNASVTRIIELLIKAGYLARADHQTDRRRSSLRVLEKGIQVITDVNVVIMKNRKTALKNITEDELHIARSVLVKIINNCKPEPEKG